MHKISQLLFAFFLLALSGLGSAAQDSKAHLPDAGRGKTLSASFCSNCHLIDSAAGGSIVAGVPSFVAIANKGGQTAEKIALKLINPHVPMPNMHLTRREIDDLIAYIGSLRKPDAGPPLLKLPKSENKPVYPKAS